MIAKVLEYLFFIFGVSWIIAAVVMVIQSFTGHDPNETFGYMLAAFICQAIVAAVMGITKKTKRG